MYAANTLFNLTDWRDDQYFNQRLNHYFLYDNGFGLKVAKVKPPTDKEAYYWFVSPAFHLKATTTRCVSLKDVAGTLVEHMDCDQVRGKLGEFGVVDTPYVYVYWLSTPLVDNDKKQLGFPVALPSYRELKMAYTTKTILPYCRPDGQCGYECERCYPKPPLMDLN